MLCMIVSKPFVFNMICDFNSRIPTMWLFVAWAALTTVEPNQAQLSYLDVNRVSNTSKSN